MLTSVIKDLQPNRPEKLFKIYSMILYINEFIINNLLESVFLFHAIFEPGPTKAYASPVLLSNEEVDELRVDWFLHN